MLCAHLCACYKMQKHSTCSTGCMSDGWWDLTRPKQLPWLTLPRGCVCGIRAIPQSWCSVFVAVYCYSYSKVASHLQGLRDTRMQYHGHRHKVGNVRMENFLFFAQVSMLKILCILMNDSKNYSQTSINWPSVEQSPSMKQPLIKFWEFTPHNYCKLSLY